MSWRRLGAKSLEYFVDFIDESGLVDGDGERMPRKGKIDRSSGIYYCCWRG